MFFMFVADLSLKQDATLYIFSSILLLAAMGAHCNDNDVDNNKERTAKDVLNHWCFELKNGACKTNSTYPGDKNSLKICKLLNPWCQKGQKGAERAWR